MDLFSNHNMNKNKDNYTSCLIKCPLKVKIPLSNYNKIIRFFKETVHVRRPGWSVSHMHGSARALLAVNSLRSNKRTSAVLKGMITQVCTAARRLIHNCNYP